MSWRLLARTMSDLGLVFKKTKSGDPNDALESLERMSRLATFVILLGILVEIALALRSFTDVWSLIGVVAPNSLIAIGLIVEYMVIGKAIVATGDAKRLSDEKVADAQKLAAEANERAANAEKEAAIIQEKIAWRRLSKEQHDVIVESLKGQTFELGVYGIRAENDPEAHLLWLDHVEMFKATNLKIIAATILATGPGVSVTPFPGPEIDALKSAFGKAGIDLLDATDDFGGRKQLALLVGNKPPPF